jgi:antitoxin PrlF
MTAATVTSKGQITIPASVRAALHLGAGDRLDFVEIAPMRYEIVPAKVSVMSLKGIFAHKARKKPVSIEEMNEAIGQAVADDFRRSVAK